MEKTLTKNLEKIAMKCMLLTLTLLVLSVNPIFAEEFTGTLGQIQKAGKLKIGYRQFQPPMSSLGKDGEPQGYSIDICRHIVSEINKKIGKEVGVEYVPVTAKDRFNALIDNRIDILCGSTTNTLSRRELVDFTQLTFVSGASYMALKGRKIRNNFDGKKVGVVKGTTTAVAIKKLFQETETNVDFVLMDSSADALDALRKEEIDIFSADQVVLIGLVSTAEDSTHFSILPDMFSYEPFSLAVRRNDADFRLIADRTIAHLFRTEQIRTIYDKWLGGFSNSAPSAFEVLVQLNAIPEK